MSTILTENKEKIPLFINRKYALLWFGQSISNIGDFFFSTTLYLWVATQLAKNQPWSPLAMSGVAFATVLPALLIGPIAGVFVDRWDKRATMLRMDAIRAIIVLLPLLMVLFVSLPVIQRPHLTNVLLLTSIYLVVALVNICSQFFSPSRLTIIGDVVPAEYRTRAVSFGSVSYNIALILGPALATPLYFAFGIQWAIIIDSLSFVVSFLAIYAVHVTVEAEKSEKIVQQTHFWREFVEGLQFFRGNRVLVVLFVGGILFQFGAGPSGALNILFAIHNLHTPSNLLGLFEANYGVGVILGLLFAAFCARRIGEVRLFWLSFLLWGSFMVMFGRTTNYLVGFALFFLLGFANAGINVVVGPLMIRATPRKFMGRVQSVMNPTIMAASLLSTTFAGILASTLLRNLHVVVSGTTFGTLDTIFSVTGLIVVGAGVYAVIALKGVELPS